MTGEVVETVDAAQAAAESNAAFAQAFDGSAEAPTPKTETQAEVKAEPEVKEEPAPDPWAGVSPALKEAFESERKRVAEMEHRLKSYEGRVAGYQKALEAATAATKGAAPTKRQFTEAIKSTEKWEKMKADFPDFADALEERFIGEREAAPPQFDANGFKTEITTSLSEQIAQAKNEARQFARLDAKYDGWEDTLRTPEFKTWYALQAPELQALGASDKAADAMKVLDAYNGRQAAAASAEEAAAKKQAEEEKQRRLRGALTPEGKGPAAKGVMTEQDAFLRAFEGG
jgi:hypothetical protein